ncbi:trypsin-like peptidase domain-containing protein [Acuticoccus sediminis]|uniref:trypsin-like peptidase domain-containing protein n=1 Tax=Acuticoccus sediminis TaxID=2184697 RepID=UPI001CFE1E2E|nr:trypsin-like peptidase domain-containing protein [Acuticoccus sediminis]
MPDGERHVGALDLFAQDFSQRTDAVVALLRASAERWREGEAQRLELGRQLRRARNHEPLQWWKVEKEDRFYQALKTHGFEKEATMLAEGAAAEEFSGTYESIIAGSDLTGIEFFERGLIAARAVARVEVPLDLQRVSYGSGVLVSPRLFLTNHHVIPSDVVAAGTTVQFEYLTTAGGKLRDPLEFAMEPGTFFKTDREMDFTLVALRPEGSNGVELRSRGWCPLIAQSGKTMIGSRANIIQHPRGERMQVAVRSNRIVTVVGDFLQYTTDTEHGSSGSPVFNDYWQLAAIHHMGVPDLTGDHRPRLDDGSAWTGDPQTASRIVTVGNEGTRISQIVQHVATALDGESERTLFAQCLEPPDAMNLWDLFVRTGTVVAVGPGLGLERPADPHAGDGPHAPRGVAGPDAHVAASLVERFGPRRGDYDKAADNVARRETWDDLDDLWGGPVRPLAKRLRQRLVRHETGVLAFAEARYRWLYPSLDVTAEGAIRDLITGDPRPACDVMEDELAGLRAAMATDPSRSIDPLTDADGAIARAEEAGVALAAVRAIAPHRGAPSALAGDLHALFALARPTTRAAVIASDGSMADEPFRKGAVARAVFYVLLRYGPVADVGDALLARLARWHAEDPVDDWERRRNMLIAGAQGTRNPFVDQPELARPAFLAALVTTDA